MWLWVINCFSDVLMETDGLEMRCFSVFRKKKRSVLVEIKRKTRQCSVPDRRRDFSLNQDFYLQMEKRNVKQIEFRHLPCEYSFDHSGFTITWHKICESLIQFIETPTESQESQLLKLDTGSTKRKCNNIPQNNSVCIQAQASFATLLHLLFYIFHQFDMKSTVRQTVESRGLLKSFFGCMASSRLNELQPSNALSNWQEIATLAFFLPQRRDEDTVLHFSSQGFTVFIVEEQQWEGFPAQRWCPLGAQNLCVYSG